MGIKDFFKTAAEREKESKLRRMRAISGAERVVDTIKDKVGELKTEKDKAWKEAIGYGKENQKSSAQRSLKTIMSIEQQIGLLETRRWSFEQVARSLELASIDADIKASVGKLVGVTDIDVIDLENELNTAFDKVRDVTDANKLWERISRKQMDGVNLAEDQAVTMEDLEQRLESAVAGSIGDESKKAQIAPETIDQISKGRADLKDLLDGKKQ
jgi:hypothetical protein